MLPEVITVDYVRWDAIIINLPNPAIVLVLVPTHRTAINRTSFGDNAVVEVAVQEMDFSISWENLSAGRFLRKA